LAKAPLSPRTDERLDLRSPGVSARIQQRRNDRRRDPSQTRGHLPRFSHLGIAFCRGLGIPARFVSCYAYGLVPSDFHAVFEAYLDRRWWLFDATHQAHLDGLVRIGIGRDAAEVAFSTPFGTFKPKVMEVRMKQPRRSPTPAS
jgi:hypothetical protein